jgi:hypothetical protein
MQKSLDPQSLVYRRDLGAPPRAPWKRHTVQPRTAGVLHRSRVRIEVAEQRGAFWKEYSHFKGMVPRGAPRPVRHRADNCLPTLIHRDALHANELLASASISLERLHPRRKGPGELVEGTFCAVLLEAVEGAFGGDVDCAMPNKIYGASPESAKGR